MQFEARRDDPDRRIYSMAAITGHSRLDLGSGVVTEVNRTHGTLFVPAELRGTYGLVPQRRLKIAALSISFARLRAMLGDRLADQLNIMVQPPNIAHAFDTPLSARLRMLMNGLFANKLHGPLRLIALEGAALQIFALQARALGLAPEAPLTVTAAEQRAIEKARERLRENLLHPPSKATLAAEVGMTEARLDSLFRRLDGTRIGGILRRERLAQARRLIESGEYPLKEIAYRSGYHHRGNFSTAFKRQYGVQPNTLRSGSRGRQT